MRSETLYDKQDLGRNMCVMIKNALSFRVSS